MTGDINARGHRPMLLIACSGAKLEGTHRAIDLYRGVMFDVLRKWRPAGGPTTYIISALHGLVHEHELVQAYEQPMTAERQRALIAGGFDLRLFKGEPFTEVYIAGGAMYRTVAEVYVGRLRAAKIIQPGALARCTSGGIGQQRGQLGAFLRGLRGA